MKKTVSIPSSTGGTITFKFDANGKPTGLVHNSGRAYSGAAAQQETQKS